MKKCIAYLIIWQTIIWGWALLNTIAPISSSYLLGFAIGYLLPFCIFAMRGDD